jgi:hypothetical protein
MSENPAPFLLLKLRSCDDLDDLKFTGEKVPVRLDLRLAYSAELADLPVLHVDLFGFSRTFAVLGVEPVQDGTNTFTFHPTPGGLKEKPTLDSIAQAWAGHLANRPDLATTKQQMQDAVDFVSDYFSQRTTSQSLAFGAAARTGN